MKKNFNEGLIFHPNYEKDLWFEAESKNLNFYINSTLHLTDCEEEEIKDADMVTLGCSFTAGCGVNFDQVWSSQVAKKLNLTNYTIAKSGGSVQWAINNFFSYLNYFKKPKIVVALFPDFVRMEIASRPEFMIPLDYENQPSGFEIEKNTITEESKIIRYKINPDKQYDLKEKYLKLPMYAKEHFPRETAFDVSVQYIKILEQYCNSNDILLIWSTWFPEQEQWLHLNIDKTIFKNYIPVDTRYWHAKKIDNRKEFICQNLIDFYNDKNYKYNLLKENNLKLFAEHNESFCDPDLKCNSKNFCHLEYSEEPNFDIARDSVEHHRGHFSYHAHIHIAERFLEKINKNNSGLIG